jgi:hypothetical protein|tara:strand:- start:1072 stop:1209 length:138 start_codon:yes stop_codon:yes gene_type:complete
MTNKQKIEANISRIDKILDEDFITVPVKEILTEIKSELKTIASNL